MIKPEHLEQYVITPTMHAYNTDKFPAYSPAAVRLLTATATHESLCGYYLRQTKGPALGVFEMEPNTHDDCWINWLRFNKDVADAVLFNVPPSSLNMNAAVGGKMPSAFLMVSDLAYAAIMARIRYRRVREPLPALNDWKGMALYWKKYYNTPQGDGTVQEFLANCKRFLPAEWTNTMEQIA